MALFFVVVKRLNNVNVDNVLACFTSAQTFFSLHKTPDLMAHYSAKPYHDRAALAGKSIGRDASYFWQ